VAPEWRLRTQLRTTMLLRRDRSLMNTSGLYGTVAATEERRNVIEVSMAPTANC
jgi:hypothetical protein